MHSNGGGQFGGVAQFEAQLAGTVDGCLVVLPMVNRGEQPGHVLDHVHLARVVMDPLVTTQVVSLAVGGGKTEVVDHPPLAGARIHGEKIEHALADLKLAAQGGERHRPRKLGLVVGKPNEAAQIINPDLDVEADRRVLVLAALDPCARVGLTQAQVARHRLTELEGNSVEASHDCPPFRRLPSQFTEQEYTGHSGNRRHKPALCGTAGSRSGCPSPRGGCPTCGLLLLGRLYFGATRHTQPRTQTCKSTCESGVKELAGAGVNRLQWRGSAALLAYDGAYLGKDVALL